MIPPATSYQLPATRGGFSLIEMMVVLTIFGIMTAVVLANFPAFRDKTALDLIAQEIATTIRQAQVYGIGTRAAGAASFSAYGIYFDLDPGNLFGTDDKTFILYSDNGTTIGSYNIGGAGVTADSLIEKFAVRGSVKISEIFGCSASACDPSASPPTGTLLTNLNILFQRFYPEATLPTGDSYVQIVIQSTRTGDTRAIQVWNTGQIVVKPI